MNTTSGRAPSRDDEEEAYPPPPAAGSPWALVALALALGAAAGLALPL